MKLILLLFWICSLSVFGSGSLQYWSGHTSGTVSVRGKGVISKRSGSSLEWKINSKIGDLPHPLRFYGSIGYSYSSLIHTATSVQIESINLGPGSLPPFSLHWDYFGFMIPFRRFDQSPGLRPRQWSLGLEWHFLDYSLNRGGVPSLMDLDRSLNALVLQPQWEQQIGSSPWKWFLEPRGVWMQDLGGSPAAHLEGEIGIERGEFRLGFKRKKTRVFPSNRLTMGGAIPSDLIFIRDGWFLEYSLKW